MSTWNESRISETTSWTQQRNWGGHLSDNEYRKRRVSWNPFIGGEELDILSSGDYEATAANDERFKFAQANSELIGAFETVSDCLEPEDDSIERMYKLEAAQVEKISSILRRVEQRNGSTTLSFAERNIRTRRRKRGFIVLLKELYGYRCQVCARHLPCPNLKIPGYTEGHHLQPLGKHDGPDIAENVIIVCPNHHILLEHGGMSLDLKKLSLLEHEIGKEFVSYHNREIYAIQ
ncbi:MAG: hypothetical protein CMO55_17870 [Verrucomicrobiales bacterium]|nr:hypothetical protein [Verrucomicrobiales bacterium]